METDKSLTGVLGFKPSVADILAYMIENPAQDHSPGEVAEATGLGKGTARLVLSQLNALGVVRVTRTLSKTNLYAIDEYNRVASLLVELFRVITGSGTSEAEKEDTAKDHVSAYEYLGGGCADREEE